MNNALLAAGLGDKRRVKVTVPENPFNGLQVRVEITKTVDPAKVEKAFFDEALCASRYPGGAFIVKVADNEGYVMTLTGPEGARLVMDASTVGAFRAVMAAGGRFTRADVVDAEGNRVGSAVRAADGAGYEPTWIADHVDLAGVTVG